MNVSKTHFSGELVTPPTLPSFSAAAWAPPATIAPGAELHARLSPQIRRVHVKTPAERQLAAYVDTQMASELHVLDDLKESGATEERKADDGSRKGSIRILDGTGGTGVTSAMKAVANQNVFRPAKGVMEIVCLGLYVCMPFGADAGMLATAIIKALAKKIRPGWRVSEDDEKNLQRLPGWLSGHKVRWIFLDQLERVKLAEAKRPTIADLISIMTNDLGINVVLGGRPEALAYIASSSHFPQLSRQMVSPLSGEVDGELENFAIGFRDQLPGPFKTSDFSDKELLKDLYQATKGKQADLYHLLCLATEKAILQNQWPVTGVHLHAAYVERTGETDTTLFPHELESDDGVYGTQEVHAAVQEAVKGIC